MKYIKSLKRKFNLWGSKKFFVKVEFTEDYMDGKGPRDLRNAPKPIAVFRRDWEQLENILLRIYVFDDKLGLYTFSDISINRRFLRRVLESGNDI